MWLHQSKGSAMLCASPCMVPAPGPSPWSACPGLLWWNLKNKCAKISTVHTHNILHPRAKQHDGWLHLATYNTQRGSWGHNVRPDWTRSRWSLLILCSSYREQLAEHTDTTESAMSQWLNNQKQQETGQQGQWATRSQIAPFLFSSYLVVCYVISNVCAISLWN